MIGLYAANTDDFINVTASDTDGSIGKDVGDGVGTFSRGL